MISLIWYLGKTPLISNYLHDIENKTYDLLFITRHNLNLDPSKPQDILIIGIDAVSIDKVGVPWPWPRQFHAALVDSLHEAGAKFIVFDIIFDTISPLSLQTQDIAGDKIVSMSSFDAGKDDDEIFAKSILKAMNVFLACEAEPLSKNRYYTVTPINTFTKAINNDLGFLGNASVKYDRDNFVREARIIFPEYYRDPPINSSIALRVAQKYLEDRATVLSDNHIKISGKNISNDFLINFYGPSESIRTIPYWEALDLIYNGNTSIFKDKVIFIGRTKLKASIDPFKSVRSPDSFPTPFAAITPNFSGVELQATILGNILNDFYIKQTNNLVFILFVLFIGVLSVGIVSLFRQRPILCFYLSLWLCALYMFAAFEAFIYLRYFIPLTYPVYGIILPIYFINFIDQYFFVDRNRRRQAKIFRQLVPPQIADEIEKMDQETLALGGTKRIVTVLFADIKNFTGLCEKNTPETVINILNTFFTAMVKVIHKHDGLVDKFIGDAIMAIWGSPKIIDEDTQINLAAKCALAMSDELKSLNQEWQKTGIRETLEIRIGINTADVITGNIGSPQRMQFSAIGDGVNIAARLEAVNKTYGTSILLSERMVKHIENNFYLREIDSVYLPGKDNPVNIHELITIKNYSKELVNLYSEALKYYRNKNFEKALLLWEECLLLNPHDNPSKTMLTRTKKLQSLSIPMTWKPIWSIENK